jgi:NADH-quinone oxidoreductase subunit L
MTLTFSQFGMLKLAPLIPLAPLAGAIVVGLLGSRRLRGASHWPVIVGAFVSALVSAMLLGIVYYMPDASFGDTYHLYDWIAPAAGVWFDVNMWIDPLTAVMLVTVCTVSFLVITYSRDYMRSHSHPERGYERFFAFLGLFVFAMCTLVLAGNFLLLYLGWEGVGLCSYLLIGFYYPKPSAAAAAKKAFIVTRIGDFGFGIGILCIYLWISPLARPGENPLDYAVVFRNVSALQGWQCTTIALLLFCGAVGKSAQLPLYVWLPDAMEGPSPVSALIHAATMVTAGVYMVARCGPIFVQSQDALAVVASIGAATAFFAATIALAQYDMKRILAYSTISQLGYMFLGLGVCAADAAIFHLFTHAFFKSLLFLAAGSVMHAMGGIIDVRQFGGLRRIMPVTYVTFLAGGLALSGFPFFSGFFSKDEIIDAAYSVHPVLGVIGLVAALLTAFYTFRMIFWAFHGPQRVPEGVHPHESGYWMLVPMAILGIGAAGAGYVDVTISSSGFAGIFEPHGIFHRFLNPVFRDTYSVFTAAEAEGAAPGGAHVTMYVSSALAVLGVLGAYVLYVRRRDWAEAIVGEIPDVYDLIHGKYYVDELYDTIVVGPARQAGLLFNAIDDYVIDGLIWLVTVVPRTGGFVLRTLQGGALQGYAVTMTMGIMLILLFVLLSG